MSEENINENQSSFDLDNLDQSTENYFDQINSD